MQKKIVAAICAAALALAMPVAAFAAPKSPVVTTEAETSINGITCSVVSDSVEAIQPVKASVSLISDLKANNGADMSRFAKGAEFIPAMKKNMDYQRTSNNIGKVTWSAEMKNLNDAAVVADVDVDDLYIFMAVKHENGSMDYQVAQCTGADTQTITLYTTALSTVNVCVNDKIPQEFIAAGVNVPAKDATNAADSTKSPKTGE